MEAQKQNIAETNKDILSAADDIGEDFSDILLDARTFNDTNLDIPNSQWFKGQYIPVDRKADTDRRDLMRVMGASNEELGLDEKAIRSVPVNEIVTMNQQLRNNAQYLNLLNLGALGVDPKDPNTSRRWFAILPELRAIPEQRLVKMHKLAMMLDHILRSGVITSRKELSLIYQLLDPRSIIPEKFPWVDLVESTEKRNFDGKQGKLYWIMNPFNFLERGKAGAKAVGVNVDFGIMDNDGAAWIDVNGTPVSQTQFKLKAIILRRLFAGVKDSTPSQIADVLRALYPGENSLTKFESDFKHSHLRVNNMKDADPSYSLKAGKSDTTVPAKATGHGY